MDRTWARAVEAEFWSNMDLGSEDIGSKFLQALLELGFVPDRFGTEDPPKQKFDSHNTNDFLNLWVARPNQMEIERLGALGFQAIVHLNPHMSKPPHSLSIGVDEVYFQQTANIARFLDFAEHVYEFTRSVCGVIASARTLNDSTVVKVTAKMGGRVIHGERHIPMKPTRGLAGVYWANFLGPVYVDFLTKEKIESAPSYRKKQLQDGGYLILTSESPLDYDSPQTKEMERKLVHHLGEDLFFDKRDPDRVLRTPFQRGPQEPKQPYAGLKASLGLRQCPECGETQSTVETSRHSANGLVAFRCSKCGAVWAVQESLLR